MLACWEKSPDKRPTFSDLVIQIDNSLTAMAGYLDFNQFKELLSPSMRSTSKKSFELPIPPSGEPSLEITDELS